MFSFMYTNFVRVGDFSTKFFVRLYFTRHVKFVIQINKRPSSSANYLITGQKYVGTVCSKQKPRI